MEIQINCLLLFKQMIKQMKKGTFTHEIEYQDAAGEWQDTTCEVYYEQAARVWQEWNEPLEGGEIEEIIITTETGENIDVTRSLRSEIENKIFYTLN